MKSHEDYVLLVDYFKTHYPKIYQEGVRAIQYKYEMTISRSTDDME